jgi:hypothetical protein
VLPSTSDLATLGVSFGLRKEVRGALRRRKREILEQLKKENGIPTTELKPEDFDRLAELRKAAAEQAWKGFSSEIGLSNEVVNASIEDVTLVGEEAAIAGDANADVAFAEIGEEAAEEQEALVAAEGVDAREEANDSGTRSGM